MYNLQIFVPKNLNDGSKAPEHVLEHVIEELCILGGGVTITHTEGAWVNDVGNVICEPMQIVETDLHFCNDPQIEDLARWVGRELKQDGVYIRTREIEAHTIDTRSK